jgi:tRNA1(Val) A37 N6-methylase TrmN6
MASTQDNEEQYIRGASDDEIQRLTDQHVMLKSGMGGTLVVAPIDLSRPGLRILDSGTGNGIVPDAFCC